MVGQQLVDSLQQEIIRLRALLESSQREVYESIREKGNYEALLDEAEGEISDLRKRLGIQNVVPKEAKAGG